MKPLLVLFLCVLASNSLRAQGAVNTFVSVDRAFQFKYSSVLVQCVPTATGSAAQPDGCVCDDETTETKTIACFAYPKDTFFEKRAFVGAAFFVAEVPADTTRRACLEGSKGWLTHATESTKINSITFMHFQVSDAWTSHRLIGDVYRAFHGKKCYELGIQEIHTDEGAFDPGTVEHFTEQDAQEVHARLQQALHSFTFLK